MSKHMQIALCVFRVNYMKASRQCLCAFPELGFVLDCPLKLAIMRAQLASGNKEAGKLWVEELIDG